MEAVNQLIKQLQQTPSEAISNLIHYDDEIFTMKVVDSQQLENVLIQSYQDTSIAKTIYGMYHEVAKNVTKEHHDGFDCYVYRFQKLNDNDLQQSKKRKKAGDDQKSVQEDDDAQMTDVPHPVDEELSVGGESDLGFDFDDFEVADDKIGTQTEQHDRYTKMTQNQKAVLLIVYQLKTTSRFETFKMIVEEGFPKVIEEPKKLFDIVAIAKSFMPFIMKMQSKFDVKKDLAFVEGIYHEFDSNFLTTAVAKQAKVLKMTLTIRNVAKFYDMFSKDQFLGDGKFIRNGAQTFSQDVLVDNVYSSIVNEPATTDLNILSDQFTDVISEFKNNMRDRITFLLQALMFVKPVEQSAAKESVTESVLFVKKSPIEYNGSTYDFMSVPFKPKGIPLKVLSSYLNTISGLRSMPLKTQFKDLRVMQLDQLPSIVEMFIERFSASDQVFQKSFIKMFGSESPNVKKTAAQTKIFVDYLQKEIEMKETDLEALTSLINFSLFSRSVLSALSKQISIQSMDKVILTKALSFVNVMNKQSSTRGDAYSFFSKTSPAHIRDISLEIIGKDVLYKDIAVYGSAHRIGDYWRDPTGKTAYVQDIKKMPKTEGFQDVGYYNLGVEQLVQNNLVIYLNEGNVSDFSGIIEKAKKGAKIILIDSYKRVNNLLDVTANSMLYNSVSPLFKMLDLNTFMVIITPDSKRKYDVLQEDSKFNEHNLKALLFRKHCMENYVLVNFRKRLMQQVIDVAGFIYDPKSYEKQIKSSIRDYYAYTIKREVFLNVDNEMSADTGGISENRADDFFF